MKTSNNSKLIAALAGYLLERKRHSDAPPDPEVIVEKSDFKDYLHYSVVWSKFESLDDMERSRVILEAIKRAKGEKHMMRVSVAMGLTPAEAKMLEIA